MVLEQQENPGTEKGKQPPQEGFQQPVETENGSYVIPEENSDAIVTSVIIFRETELPLSDILFEEKKVLHGVDTSGIKQTPPKSPRMMEVEAAHDGEPVANIIHRLYHGEGLSLTEASKRMHVDEKTLRKWMDTLEVPYRKRITPGIKKMPLAESEVRAVRESAPNKVAAMKALGMGSVVFDRTLELYGIEPYTRGESLKNYYLDEERKAAAMAKVHSETARLKRAKSVEESWKRKPVEQRPGFKKGEEKMAETFSKLFGDNPQETFQAYIDAGMSKEKIAAKIGRSKGTVMKYARLLNVNYPSEWNTGAQPQPSNERYALIRRFRKHPQFTWLSDAEQEFINRRFPVKGKPESLSSFGVSRQAASQMEQRIMRTIRNLCAKQNIEL